MSRGASVTGISERRQEADCETRSLEQRWWGGDCWRTKLWKTLEKKMRDCRGVRGASESSSHCEQRSISLHPPVSINCSAAAAAAAVTTGNGANWWRTAQGQYVSRSLYNPRFTTPLTSFTDELLLYVAYGRFAFKHKATVEQEGSSAILTLNARQMSLKCSLYFSGLVQFRRVDQ